MLTNYLPAAKSTETPCTLCHQSIFLWINGRLLLHRIFIYGLYLQSQSTNYAPGFRLFTFSGSRFTENTIYIPLYQFTVTDNGAGLREKSNHITFYSITFFPTLLKKEIRIVKFMLSHTYLHTFRCFYVSIKLHSQLSFNVKMKDVKLSENNALVYEDVKLSENNALDSLMEMR